MSLVARRQELRPACLRHRGVLVALVDREERSAATAAALDHLSVCGRCRTELTQLSLTIHALRRLGEASARVAPPEATWPRLRVHLERSRRQARAAIWRWRLNLSGLVASTLIVGILVGPLAVELRYGTAGQEPTGFSASEMKRFAAQVEARYIQTVHSGTLPSQRQAPPPTAGGSRNPDDIRPERKEVTPPRATGFGPEAR